MKLTKSRLQQIIKEEINNLGEGWWPFGGDKKKKAAPEAEQDAPKEVTQQDLFNAWKDDERMKFFEHYSWNGYRGFEEALAADSRTRDMEPVRLMPDGEDEYYFRNAMQTHFAKRYNPPHGISLEDFEEYNIPNSAWPRKAKEDQEGRDVQSRVDRKIMSKRFGEKEQEKRGGYGPAQTGYTTKKDWDSPFRESKQRRRRKKK